MATSQGISDCSTPRTLEKSGAFWRNGERRDVVPLFHM